MCFWIRALSFHREADFRQTDAIVERALGNRLKSETLRPGLIVQKTASLVRYDKIFLVLPDRSKKEMHAEDNSRCVEFKPVTRENAAVTVFLKCPFQM